MELITFFEEFLQPWLYHNYSMSPIPQKLIANYSIRGLAVPRAVDRSFVTGSIHDGSRSRLTLRVTHPEFAKGGRNRRSGGYDPTAGS